MPPASLAGKLQRGLGSGFLEAVGRTRVEVQSLVLDCIAHDPRISQQDESRELYYARLVLALGIEDRHVASILAHEPDADTQTTRDWLPLGVLGLLARSGRPQAVSVVRGYVAGGAWWSEAIRHLADARDPGVLEGLDQVLADRYHGDPDGLAMDAGPSDEEPWRTWSERGPLAPLLAADPYGAWRPEKTAELEALGPAELLRSVAAPARPVDPAVDLLASRIAGGSAADRRVVENALRSADRELAARAVRVLGTLGDPAIVPVGEQILVEIGGGFGVPGYRLRTLILRGFEGLPPDDALRVARRWRDADDYRDIVATELLALHATDEDLPWTVDAVRRAAAAGDNLWPHARILRRFPGTGPFDGFDVIYRTYTPSCCRGHLVEAMSIADPTFGDTLAWECLWDCEGTARRAAAQTVAWSPGSEHRLRELAWDPLEDEDVTDAARARLGSPTA